MPYFLVFRDNAGEWRWTLYGANGEAVAVSEGYSSKWNAKRSVSMVKRIVPNAEIRIA